MTFVLLTNKLAKRIKQEESSYTLSFIIYLFSNWNVQNIYFDNNYNKR